MRQLLFFFLRVSKFFRRIRLSLLGKTEDDIHSQRIVSGKSWEEFCDQIKLAGTILKHSGTPQDPFNQAEGVRYLTRLTRAGLEAFVEYCDPAFPVFRRMVHETVKMGADNPDNYYFNAQISGKYSYRIKGKRNTVNYIGFFTQNGNYGTTGGLAPCGVLEGKDLSVDEDGNFEIILSKTPQGKSWLKIEDETTLVMVRQTFFDRFNEIPAELSIENISGKTTPDPITPRMIDEGLKTASMFVAGAPLLFARWANGFKKHANRLPLFDPAVSNAAGGDASIIYYHSYWKLEPDEALVIKVMPPSCESWNFQLNNYWMESLDYRYFTICISKGNATYQPDGSVQLIISHNDPQESNWIHTCGHNEGTMCWRWYRISEGAQAVEPHCEVIKLTKLKSLE
jgi:hypothetical protein